MPERSVAIVETRPRVGTLGLNARFMLVLLVGVAAGTYSSIGIASQLLVAWERNDIGRWFKRMRGQSDTQVAEPA